MKKVKVLVNLNDAINLYESGKTLKEVGEIFGVSDETIRQKLIKNNVKIRSLKVAKRKYSLNENFFK